MGIFRKKKKKARAHLPTKDLMKRLWRDYLRHYKGRIAASMFFMIIGGATTAAIAQLLDPIVNEVLVNKDRETLWWLGAAIVATFLARGLAGFAERVLMASASLRAIADIRRNLFSHVAKMDVPFFQRHASGTLTSRFTVDTQQMRFAMAETFTALGKDTSTLLFLIGAMFYRDWQLTIAAVFVFPLAIFPIARLGRRMRKVTANTQKEMGQLTTILSQTIQGIRQVKAYGMEDYETTRVGGIINVVRKLQTRAQMVRALATPIMELLAGIGVLMVLFYGGLRVIDGVLTPGAFVAFIASLMLAYEPLKRLANLNSNLQRGLAGAQRTFEILDTTAVITDKPGAKTLQLKKGEISFKGVSFSYDKKKHALRGIELDIKPDSKVALVGPSGAGKSTVFNLLLRFFDVDAGTVSIDGQNVQEVTLDSLREKISLVSQEVTLFDDTVRANIAYGRLDAPEEDIINAAKAAGAHEFITAMPEGYDTVVGEHGTKLSGGQRQRIAIARAILKDAPIVLLDEATSALDTKAERDVQDAMRKLMKGRTTLAIAHRLSTILDADVICYMDKGQIVERGTHKQLMRKKGAYAHLYELQFAGQAASEKGGDVPAAPQ